MQHQAPMHQWPAVVETLFHSCVEAFEHNDSGSQQPQELASVALTSIGHYLGGRIDYLQKLDSMQRKHRNQQIERDSLRMTHGQLAERYGLTSAAIGQILRAMRKQRTSKD